MVEFAVPAARVFGILAVVSADAETARAAEEAEAAARASEEAEAATKLQAHVRGHAVRQQAAGSAMTADASVADVVADSPDCVFRNTEVLTNADDHHPATSTSTEPLPSDHAPPPRDHVWEREQFPTTPVDNRRLIAMLHSSAEELINAVLPNRPARLGESKSCPAFDRLTALPTPAHVRRTMRSLRHTNPTWHAAVSTRPITTSGLPYRRPPLLQSPPAYRFFPLASSNRPAPARLEPSNWHAPISSCAIETSRPPHRRPPMPPREAPSAPATAQSHARRRRAPDFVPPSEPRGGPRWVGPRPAGPNDRYYRRGVQRRLDEIQGGRTPVRERLANSPGFANLASDKKARLLALTQAVDPARYNRRDNAPALEGENLRSFIERLDLGEESTVRAEMAVLERELAIHEMLAKLRKGTR